MRVSLFCILLIIFQVSFASQVIETIQINHRPANDILPDLQPFVSKDATIRAVNEFIVIKASEKEIKQIKQLINTLDTPPQRIMLTVLQTDEVINAKDTDHVAADIIVNGESSKGSVSLKKWSTQNLRNQDHVFQIQTLTGKAVLIQLGDAVAKKEQKLILFSDGRAVAETHSRYLDITNGFQAIARVLPNHQVVIDIVSYASSSNKRNENIRQSNILSTISGPVGTWLQVGQIDNEKMFDQEGSTRYHSHHQLQQTVYIKLDLL